MAANLSAFIKYLGHSQIAIKSIVTGKPGAQEGHFQAITINKAEEFITLRNGKRQLWINLQKLKPKIGKYIAFSDIESYKNVYIDLDCEKPDGMKNYAATEEERAKALSQLPILQAWLKSQGLKCGLGLHTGNGAGMVLPIPETKAEPVFIAKLSTFLKKVQADIPCTDPAMFDPPRVIGIPSTINAKLETEDRKNQVREIVGDIPARAEDQALLDFINAQVPDQATLKEWSKKFNEPQVLPEDDKDTIDAEDILDRLTGLFEYEPELKALLDGHIERFKGDRSAAEYGVCGRLVKFGFTDTEINFIMCKVSKIGKWAEEGPHYRFNQTLRKLREAEAGKEEPKGPTVIDAIRLLSAVCDGATTKDGVGFSRFDREEYDDVILKAVSGDILTPREEKKAWALVKKYKKQLKKMGMNIDDVGHIARGGSVAREDAGPINSDQREIIVTNRHMQDITAESLPELVAYNNPPKIFVKAGYLVQIAVDEKEITRIEILGESALKSNLSRCARYMRVANEEGDLAATDAPGKVVKDVMALPNWPGILPIVGLISSPVVRPDGSIIDQPGHDAATGLFYTGDVGMALTVPDSPTQEEAVNAAAYILTEVFGDFPFREQASRANTLAALLTTLTLPLIGGNIPLGLFDKPQAGTGASLLTEIIAELVTGEKANMQTAPDNDEEWRKAITAVLMQGPQIVVIDNVTSALKSSKLSQMLTARIWSDRMLSQTKMLNLPQTAAWFATGNNIQLGGDIARRSYWIRLDAASARPWLRDGFRHHDILAWVEEHRSELLSMLLTMVRAWIVAGKPEGIAPKIGSFENWSQVIGGILTFAKVEGFLGNAAELYDSADQDIAQWDLFLDEWQKLHRDDKITSGMLKIELTDIQPIYKSFQSEMPEEIIKATDKSTRGAVGLGKALSRHVDQVFPSGRKLTVEVDSHTKGKNWSVTTIKRSAVDVKGTETQASDPFAVDAVVGLTPSQNQKGNISGMGEREEKSGIIPERNGGRAGPPTASTAKRSDDIESGTLPSTAKGDGSSPAKKEDHGFTKFKKSMAKRVCYFCGRTFPYDLSPFYNAGISGYQCVTCHMDGPPPASMPIDAQIKLSEVKT